MVPAILRLGRFGYFRGWLILIAACALLGGVRIAAEKGRLRDETDAAKSRKLSEIFDDQRWISVAGVEAGVLGGGKPLEFRQADSRFRIAEVTGATIGPEYAGWTMALRFARGSAQRFQDDRLVGVRIIPPPGVTLRAEPTPLWWAVEYLRAFLLLAAMNVWGAGLVLTLSVRGIRRAAAPWSFAAALVSLFAASLASDFQWDCGTLLHSHSFETAAAMALIALLLWLVPNRRIECGRCRTCNYDLTGNESGICPECGTETPRQLRQRRLAEMAPAADRLVNVIVAGMEDEGVEV